METIMVLVWMVSLVAIFVYGFKWFKHRQNTRIRQRNQKKLLISVAVMVVSFVMVGVTGGNTEKSSSSDSSNKTEKISKKTKYVGKDKYDIAKKENVALIAKKKKLSKQEDKLQGQRDDIETQEAEAKQKAEEEQATAKKQEEQQAKEAQKQQEAAQKRQQKQAQEAQQQQQQQSQQAQSQQSTSQQGDMNTAETGTIIGNSRSHIYHVPGQRGYNMNSSNAVRFNTEQDAINAGYRRSKV
ncbi:hypothetical protein FD33_GL001233 [Companilactobacillus paralimentarius DSM 13238 = JCM 10415]|uniref:DNA-entry nuclease n=1 Tax=Companilactobacillus paralimentarius DSM 13238 = JCM 10415 TaxID=1122151 RepID=A0A0R1PQC2_9LACO|nr:hypothetical protein [Companilactobacillus paralimentarius]KAE9564792.1 hypothetical protein ATN96_06945 [Companilactobacillus paralimentarius]KRL32053.1 hypothetical protein FD33_GL001233 [Companilactobacillus paralimentarius DSM 13238 = JCM 10415]MDR4932673.1 DNA-entry nuclease [Companilactobacillus paralimentarius]